VVFMSMCVSWRDSEYTHTHTHTHTQKAPYHMILKTLYLPQKTYDWKRKLDYSCAPDDGRCDVRNMLSWYFQDCTLIWNKVNINSKLKLMTLPLHTGNHEFSSQNVRCTQKYLHIWQLPRLYDPAWKSKHPHTHTHVTKLLSLHSYPKREINTLDEAPGNILKKYIVHPCHNRVLVVQSKLCWVYGILTHSLPAV
jgi:hypothetical protein